MHDQLLRRKYQDNQGGNPSVPIVRVSEQSDQDNATEGQGGTRLPKLTTDTRNDLLQVHMRDGAEFRPISLNSVASSIRSWNDFNTNKSAEIVYRPDESEVDDTSSSEKFPLQTDSLPHEMTVTRSRFPPTLSPSAHNSMGHAQPVYDSARESPTRLGCPFTHTRTAQEELWLSRFKNKDLDHDNSLIKDDHRDGEYSSSGDPLLSNSPELAPYGYPWDPISVGGKDQDIIDDDAIVYDDSSSYYAPTVGDVHEQRLDYLYFRRETDTLSCESNRLYYPPPHLPPVTPRQRPDLDRGSVVSQLSRWDHGDYDELEPGDSISTSGRGTGHVKGTPAAVLLPPCIHASLDKELDGPQLVKAENRGKEINREISRIYQKHSEELRDITHDVSKTDAQRQRDISEAVERLRERLQSAWERKHEIERRQQRDVSQPQPCSTRLEQARRQYPRQIHTTNTERRSSSPPSWLSSTLRRCLRLPRAAPNDSNVRQHPQQPQPATQKTGRRLFSLRQSSNSKHAKNSESVNNWTQRPVRQRPLPPQPLPPPSPPPVTVDTASNEEEDDDMTIFPYTPLHKPPSPPGQPSTPHTSPLLSSPPFATSEANTNSPGVPHRQRQKQALPVTKVEYCEGGVSSRITQWPTSLWMVDDDGWETDDVVS